MQMDAASRLERRLRRSPAEYDAAAAAIAASYGLAPFQPAGCIGDLEPCTAYLVGMDERHRRTYAWTPPAGLQGQQGAAAIEAAHGKGAASPAGEQQQGEL